MDEHILNQIHQATDIHASVSISDHDGNITYVNNKFCDITGFSRDELLGNTHSLVSSGLHSKEIIRGIWSKISIGEVWQGQLYNKRKDGSLYWSETTIVPQVNDEGVPFQYVSVGTEITKDKKIECNLRHQTKLLHLLNDATAVLLSTSSEDLAETIGYILKRVGEQLRSRGLCLWAFEETSMQIELYYEWWATDTSPIFSESKKNLFSDFFAREVIPENISITEYLEQVQRQINPEEISEEQLRPSTLFIPLQTHGKTTHVIQLEQSINPIGDNVDEVNILMILADSLSSAISRNQSEQLMEAQRERISRSQQYANIGTWDLDLRTNELYASEYVAPMFGYHRRELNTSLDKFIAACHPDDVDKIKQAMNSCIHNDTLYDLEHRIIWPDGSERWLHQKGAVTRDAEGNPLHMLGVIQEINQRKHAERDLIKAREEAERANHAKSDFLSRMSHELRTPMNAILGFGKLMTMDTNLSEENQDNIHEILSAGHHLLDLINDVLDLAKVEAGHIELTLETLDLRSLIKECLIMVESSIREHNITVSQTGLQGITVRADSTRLKQVVINLLTNAIKYNKSGGSIHIEAIPQSNSKVRILVQDTGRGISKEKLEEVFTPFNRLGANATEIEGTGIGLTITKHLLEKMGGSIGVESTRAVGSTFWVELQNEPLDTATFPVNNSEAMMTHHQDRMLQ